HLDRVRWPVGPFDARDEHRARALRPHQINRRESFFERVWFSPGNKSELELVRSDHISPRYHPVTNQLLHLGGHKTPRFGVTQHRVTGIERVGAVLFHLLDGVQDSVTNVVATLIPRKHKIDALEPATLLNAAHNLAHIIA